MTGHAIGTLRSETAVPGRRLRVTAEAQVGDVLLSQHMAVGRPMGLVADIAALDPGGLVFMEKRTPFVGVAADALLLFEPGQSYPESRFMRIVAGSTGYNSFLKPVPPIQLELGEDVLVAARAICVFLSFEKRRSSNLAVNVVAGGAIERGFPMRAVGEPGAVFFMTGQAFLRFCAGRVGGGKREYARLASFVHVLFRAPVAGRAGRFGQAGMGPGGESLDHFFVTSAARLRVFRLGCRLGRDPNATTAANAAMRPIVESGAVLNFLFLCADNSNLLEKLFVHLISLLTKLIYSINSIGFIINGAENVKRKRIVL